MISLTTKSPSNTIAAFGCAGGFGKTLSTHAGYALESDALKSTEQVRRLAEELPQRGERGGHRRVGPLERVRRQLVVVRGARRLEIDVLPHVGDRPADVGAQRERRDTGCLQLRGVA